MCWSAAHKIEQVICATVTGFSAAHTVNDTGMIEVAQYLVYLLESAAFPPVHGRQLHRVMISTVRVLDTIDGSHATLCDVSQYTVVSNLEVVPWLC